MKKIAIIIAFSFCLTIIFVTSCKPSEAVASKTGAQIWGENCVRCHNAASPATFSDVEWEVAARHMEIRANLTPNEAKKVIEFLQSAN